MPAPAILSAAATTPTLLAAAAVVPPRLPLSAVRHVVVTPPPSVPRVGENGPPIRATGPLNESGVAASTLPAVLPCAPRALEPRLTQPMGPRLAPTPIRVASTLPREVRPTVRATPPLAGVARAGAEPRPRARTTTAVGACAVLGAPHAVRPLAGGHAPVAPVEGAAAPGPPVPATAVAGGATPKAPTVGVAASPAPRAPAPARAVTEAAVGVPPVRTPAR